MYAGCLVESAATRDLFRAPAHPYTQGLLAQVLRADARAEASGALDGLMPVLIAPPEACPFRERCEAHGHLRRGDAGRPGRVARPRGRLSPLRGGVSGATAGVPLLETQDLRTHFRQGGWLHPPAPCAPSTA